MVIICSSQTNFIESNKKNVHGFQHTFDALLCVGVSEWLLKTGLAGVRGQLGDPISKSSFMDELPADEAKWL